MTEPADDDLRRTYRAVLAVEARRRAIADFDGARIPLIERQALAWAEAKAYHEHAAALRRGEAIKAAEAYELLATDAWHAVDALDAWINTHAGL